MANTLNSALTTQTGYAANTSLIYALASKTVLEKFREAGVFTAAASRFAGDAGRTNQIDMKKWDDLSRGGLLSEAGRIPIDYLGNSSVSLTIYEYGHATGSTWQARNFDFIDLVEAQAMELGEDARMTQQLDLRDGYYAGTNIVYAEDATGFDSIAASDKFSFNMMDRLITKMRLLKALPFRDAVGNYFVVYIHPNHESQLQSEINSATSAVRYNMFKVVNDYSPSVVPFEGEIGRYKNLRLISTPLVKQGIDSGDIDSYDVALDGTGASSVDLLSGLVVGRQALTYYIAQEPVFKTDSEDFERIQLMAWHAAWGKAVTNNSGIIKFYTGANEN